MTLVMSFINFAIFVAAFLGFDYYLKKRSNKDEVYFMATEENWYKILMIILGASVLIVDLIAKQSSFFVYAVLILSYTFTFKEIGSAGIVCNLRRTSLKDILKITIEEKPHGYHVFYEVKSRTFEMIVRKKMAAGLEEAVKQVNKQIVK